MKKNKFTLGWFFISLLMAFAVTACDDDDNDVVNVTFPEKQTIGGAVNETKSLTFDAVADWTLTSSSTWCYFITEETPAAKAAEGVKEYAISGKAGKQTVTIGISEEGQEYDQATVASIIIRMNGQEAVLAEVTRNAAGRTFKLYKKGEGDAWVEVSAEEGIEAGYDNFIQYKAEANFRFAATNRPEWLSIEGGSIVGAANQEVLFGIKVVEGRPEYSKYEQNAPINFQDEEGKSVFTYPVNYKGMDPEAMELSGPNPYNWVVSLDGKTFVQTSTSGAEGTSINLTYNNFVEYTVDVLKDDFVPVFVEEYDNYGMTAFKTNIPNPELPDEPMVDWIHITKNGKNKVRITVDPSDTKRKGYVLILPKALYEQVAADPFCEKSDNGLIGNDESTGEYGILSKFQNFNMLMVFTQDQIKTGEEDKKEFSVKLWGFQETNCSDITNEFEIDFIKTTFGKDVIMKSIQANSGEFYTISPMMSEEEINFAGVEVYNDQGTNITEQIKPEPASDDNGMAIGIAIPGDWDGAHLYVAFKGNESGKDYKKVLMITPQL
ncbi:DUF5003 domain-containing protein [Phocaeicola plebeius]|uniref:DUF5003 domain-containing protein n=1 Tax=Phocaeicola plebeius TaxID=310297 RepID=A0A415JAP8_9BACT|nr:DUF5003 domain-containing protein [Phocaeicola plebeius]RHK99000.1 DUF5003 domain-containing protein [Phocaeicola plebeius]RHL17512.1 DUF5003 domain-containing protein [Phocaeicola plebeius]